MIRASAVAEFPGFRALASTALDGGWRLLPKAELARGLLYENFISTSGVVLRRHLLTEIGPFNESLVYAEDLDLWFRLANRCDALFWNNIGHAYRNRPGSLTNKLGTRSPSDHITVLEREKRTRTDPVARRQLDLRIAENLAGLAYQERRRQRRLRSAAMFAAAFATFPEGALAARNTGFSAFLADAIPQSVDRGQDSAPQELHATQLAAQLT